MPVSISAAAAAASASIPTNPSPSIFFIASSPFRFAPLMRGALSI
jgi:hypothetical protein